MGSHHLSFFDFSEIFDLPGFSLGHGSDLEGKTGLTVLLCPEGARAGAFVLGSATGTRQLDSLTHPAHVGTRAHAVVLAGGSGAGLAAATPVVEHLEQLGRGFATGFGVVPIVPTAILFDLAFGDPAARPGPELARAALTMAAESSGAVVPVGSVGAGTGATVGKALGPERGMKGGFGFAAVRARDDDGAPIGPTVAAAVAVNAFGDVVDPETGRVLAGCRTSPDGLELAGAARVVSRPPDAMHAWEGNTTLAVVMTDADLDRSACLKVSQMAIGGFYRSFVPALSLYDGDLVITLSHGAVPGHPNQVGLLAERAVTRAIVRAVEAADGFGLLPAARDLPPAA